jgi:cobalamin biosynthesis protein CobD/CbiB
MNALIDKVFVFFRRFKKLIKLIDKKTSVKSVVKSVAGALLLSILIIAIPVLVIINMFIYAKLTFLLSVFLVIIVMGWSFLYYFFYYKLLKNYHEELSEINTKIPQLVESSIVATFFFFIGIIVLATIF